jgi:hypothetical protein
VRAIDLNERGFIVNWLVRLALVFALTGVVIYDAGSMAINFFGLDSTADEVAVKVSGSIQPGIDPDPDALKAQARALAKEAGARLTTFTVESGNVRLTLKRRADTLVVSRVGFMKDWARATADGQAGTI